MKNINKFVLANIVVLLSIALLVAWYSNDNVKIFLIGDSTMAKKPIIDNPEHGWGQVFHFFK